MIHGHACGPPDDFSEWFFLRFITPPLELFECNHFPLQSNSSFNSLVHEKWRGKIMLTACSSLVFTEPLYIQARMQGLYIQLFHVSLFRPAHASTSRVSLWAPNWGYPPPKKNESGWNQSKIVLFNKQLKLICMLVACFSLGLTTQHKYIQL